jgi:hypothetical protein
MTPTLVREISGPEDGWEEASVALSEFGCFASLSGVAVGVSCARTGVPTLGCVLGVRGDGVEEFPN